MIHFRVSEAAAHAIVEQAEYFRETAGEGLSARWEKAVDKAVGSLLKFPERGAPCRFRSPLLAGLRWIFVPGFPKHMMFYRYSAKDSTFLVVQIIHGSRDIDAILEDRE